MMMPIRGVVTAVAAAVWAGPAAAADKKDDDKGWVALFNGKDLSGWKIHPNPNKEIKDITKKEVDGKVVAYEGTVERQDGPAVAGRGRAARRRRPVQPPVHRGRGDYENFHYRVEAKINDKGNSGQYFRTKFGPGFPKGYEAQINATHGDRVKTGSLYPSPGSGQVPRQDRSS